MGHRGRATVLHQGFPAVVSPRGFAHIFSLTSPWSQAQTHRSGDMGPEAPRCPTAVTAADPSTSRERSARAPVSVLKLAPRWAVAEVTPPRCRALHALGCVPVTGCDPPCCAACWHLRALPWRRTLEVDSQIGHTQHLRVLALSPMSPHTGSAWVAVFLCHCQVPWDWRVLPVPTGPCISVCPQPVREGLPRGLTRAGV